MVLCKHFQSGSCRFGSKCNNEHIDIKQLVKNDTEGAINGKQFPFSCYGPFKDKPSIPNFIEDQSFEEVRLLCYEARRNNQFELFHQQYSMGFADAMNKLKALLQPSYELMNVLFMMYDSPAGANGNGSNSTSTDASSIFGKSTTINNGGSVFAGSNIFGGGTNTNNTAGSIFGGQTNIAAQQQQTSIFSQQQQQQQQPAQQQQQQGNSGSIFGGLTKPSLFGQQQTTSTAGTGFGLFAQAAQQSGLFNQASTFGQQQQQQQQPTAFVQNSFTVQPVQQTIGGTFQAHQPQTQNMFGQNIQQNPQPVAMGSNIFAQAMQQNIAAAPTNGGGFFQQDGAGGFTQQQQQQQMLQQQHQMMSQQQQTNQMQNTVAHNSVYSNLSDLTADEIDAFRADFFEPGRLPISPPPLELLN